MADNKLPEKIAGQTLRLELPVLHSERTAVVYALGEAGGRLQIWALVAGAALMLCWPGARGKQGVPRYEYDVLKYGAAVWDFLQSQGADDKDVLAAGSAAIDLIMDSVVTQGHVSGAESFSTDPTGASRSNSWPSSARGVSSPDGSPPSTQTSKGS